MKSIRCVLLVTFLATSRFLYAQDSIIVKNPPIIVEPMMSDRGFYIQTIINKKIQSLPKLGFFSASGILNEWNSNQAFEVMSQSYITFEVGKRFALNTGFHYSNITGMRPTVGFTYTHVNPIWFVTVFPRIDISKERNLETFGMIEYKPKINDKVTFYSRLQATFVHNLKDNHHERSYIYLRYGIKFREFAFGFAYNIDYYGEMKLNRNSIGSFLMIQLY